MLSEREQAELVGIAQGLIRIPSLSGREGEAGSYCAAAMRRLGYHDVVVDDWGNVIGVIRGHGHGSVLFDAHLDTVPVGVGWVRDPLGGDVGGGRLWGRGAADMKGGAAAALFGVARLLHTDATTGTIYVCCSVCEEPSEGPMLVEVCRRVRPGAVVIAEPTGLRVNIGQRGRAELVFETVGKAAHSSRPDLGENAVRRMAELIVAAQAIQLPRDSTLGSATLEVTDVISDPHPGLSVIPNRCRATFDYRSLPGETEESILAPIARLAASFSGEVRIAETRVTTYTGASYTYHAFAPAWRTRADSALVRAACDALRRSGQSAELGAYSFCTNGSGSAGTLGILTIGYGPGRESEAHTVDEYVDLDQLYGAAEGFTALAESLSVL